MRLYPGVKLSIGPYIKDGYYYDFDMETKLTEQNFGKIEKEMRRIIKQALPIERIELTRDEAISLMQEKNQDYKIELINDIPEGELITAYRQGDYTEICRGPHLENTNQVNLEAFKLLSVAGAYWRGDSNNKMLQRVYGTVFETKEELDEYLTAIEEAKKRDHRKLGKELELFTFMEEGPGFPFFLPKGKILRNELENYWRKIHKRAGYEEISTPVILSQELWHQSGHWDHYKDNMYTTLIDDRDFAVKPMNCPGSMLVYKAKPHSYKEFPLKFAELGLVHRHENSGNLHGLMRVRCFTQDDAHIFMTTDQITQEVSDIIDLIDQVYNKMGFKYTVELSTRPEDSMGSDEDWERAIKSLADALEFKGIDYTINEGDGAFYGPKIDFHLEDCLKRTWQCGTIQLDFQMPERFDLTYIGEDGQKHRPVMVHRVVLGSIERFIGILTENTMGKFPTWIAPVQVDILPISEKHIEYAKKLGDMLDIEDIRFEIDDSNNTFGKKIRESALRKVPYALIIGDNEMNDNTVSVKIRDIKEQETMTMERFIEMVKKDIAEN
jgi:threonyl-tRNA synthetase